jgi:hypothetical protein
MINLQGNTVPVRDEDVERCLAKGFSLAGAPRDRIAAVLQEKVVVLARPSVDSSWPDNAEE